MSGVLAHMAIAERVRGLMERQIWLRERCHLIIRTELFVAGLSDMDDEKLRGTAQELIRRRAPLCFKCPSV